MICYLDSSVVLRILFREENPYKGWGKWQRAVSSELLRIEGYRTLDRIRLDNVIDDSERAHLTRAFLDMLARLAEIELTRNIRELAAQPFPTHLRTLDALHLATALVYRNRYARDIVFVTHDEQQATASQALGLTTVI